MRTFLTFFPSSCMLYSFVYFFSLQGKQHYQEYNAYYESSRTLAKQLHGVIVYLTQLQLDIKQS